MKVILQVSQGEASQHQMFLHSVGPVHDMAPSCIEKDYPSLP